MEPVTHHLGGGGVEEEEEEERRSVTSSLGLYCSCTKPLSPSRPPRTAPGEVGEGAIESIIFFRLSFNSLSWIASLSAITCGRRRRG